ncbi:hypothetical protein ASPTUDRAFT_38265 [Aspergillus tubingensis CBS 134.48]|uniref:GRF-like zinc ribbon domain-containing protein n=1 Tax=Aspergillus tubingensis (strain CBS 134.48) TaxID=767770 RepID=A0A1L9NPY6_ASPTC|nr:hypothetical protein ASPTUDRAFT_38265 [Aspergillus tubingensis CBS 134.48]
MADQVPRLFNHAPHCCDVKMDRRQTQSNSKGNIGRWYYTCVVGCRRMIFDDWEGIRDGNPLCRCRHLSRGQVERDDFYIFRCARGRCDFKENEKDVWL